MSRIPTGKHLSDFFKKKLKSKIKKSKTDPFPISSVWSHRGIRKGHSSPSKKKILRQIKFLTRLQTRVELQKKQFWWHKEKKNLWCLCHRAWFLMNAWRETSPGKSSPVQKGRGKLRSTQRWSQTSDRQAVCCFRVSSPVCMSWLLRNQMQQTNNSVSVH